MKKLIMMICAAAGFLVLAGSVTATPVSYYLWDNSGGTWADADKTATSNDDLMCWAAAASNVLEWTGWGKVAGLTNTDQMFTYFQQHWTDNGGMMKYGWNWWFSGTYNGPTGGSLERQVGSTGSGWSQPNGSGGGDFYPSQNFNNYFHETWGSSVSLSAIDQYLHSGYGTTLAVYSPDIGHALTCWGFQYDADNSGYYTGIYVTDSDDHTDALQYYALKNIGGIWYLQNFYGTNNTWAIEGVESLAAAPVIPEPATICLLAMGSLAFMRKKK